MNLFLVFKISGLNSDIERLKKALERSTGDKTGEGSQSIAIEEL